MIDFATRRTMMVDTQVRPNDVTRLPVIDAMLTIPREEFVPPARRNVAYSEDLLDLGHGRAMLEPRTLAKMVDVLNPQPDDLVMDLACGYGYGAAVLARMVQTVIAVEEDEEIAAEAEQRLNAAEIFNVAVVRAPLVAGNAAQAPFDAILIEGGIEVLPDAIAEQLNEGGRIVALFLEGSVGVVRRGQKVAGHIAWHHAFNAHAPLLPGFAKERGFSL